MYSLNKQVYSLDYFYSFIGMLNKRNIFMLSFSDLLKIHHAYGINMKYSYINQIL